MIQYLVKSDKIDKRSRNSKGKTFLHILSESPIDSTSEEIRKILIKGTTISIVPNVEFLRKMSDVIMVVVVLIATMAFQAAVSPPGGVWQDDSSTHRAGEAVIASTNPELYKNFVRANMVAFVSSLITIFLLTTGLPSGHPFLMAAVMYTMWVSLASIGVSYGASVMVITPNLETLSLASVVKIVLVVSLSFYGIIILFLWIMRLYPWWKSIIQQWVDSNCVGIRPFSRFVFHLLDYLYQIWF